MTDADGRLEGLTAILDEAAAAIDGISVDGAPGARSWSVGGTPFARESGGGILLALDPAVARAAVRTPDTEASDLEPGWVAFRPGSLDEHAIDRLTAWFAHAARRASG